MEVVIVRLARPEEKAAVLAFCEHTWEWGDYLAEVWDDVQALAICGPQPTNDEVFMVEYLDGTSEGIGDLAYELRALAAAQRLKRADVVIPDLLMLRDVLEGTGYQAVDSGAFWVYQHSLVG